MNTPLTHRLKQLALLLCWPVLPCLAQTTTPTLNTSSAANDARASVFEFSGQVTAPSCAIQFNGQSSSTFTLNLPSLSADFFDRNPNSPVSRFNLEIAVTASQANEPNARQCALLSSSSLQLQFDLLASALTESGRLKNTLNGNNASNILVEVVRFNDASSNFQALDLRQAQTLKWPVSTTGTNRNNAALQLGVRFVRDPAPNQEVRTGGFSAYLPFLLKYE